MNRGTSNRESASWFRQFIERLSELTGWYRLAALSGGSLISFGVVVKSPSRLKLGRGVQVQRGTLLHAGGKAWCGYSGHIHLADGVRIGPHCVVYGAGGVEMGEHAHLGPGVKLMSQSGRHSNNRLSGKPDYNFDPIHIGAGTWVGAGAVVLGGSRIGRCVSIGPNAVVSGDIPDFAVVVGNPGRVMFYNTGNSND